jgi:hypothetical protein
MSHTQLVRWFHLLQLFTTPYPPTSWSRDRNDNFSSPTLDHPATTVAEQPHTCSARTSSQPGNLAWVVHEAYSRNKTRTDVGTFRCAEMTHCNRTETPLSSMINRNSSTALGKDPSAKVCRCQSHGQASQPHTGLIITTSNMISSRGLVNTCQAYKSKKQPRKGENNAQPLTAQSTVEAVGANQTSSKSEHQPHGGTGQQQKWPSAPGCFWQ